ncbi:MAG: hypothetical protein ACFFBD_06490 [Candidatus Hodarchaeota archaeon]
MKMKNLTKKVWVEIKIDDLESREEFAVVCPYGATCWAHCPTWGPDPCKILTCGAILLNCPLLG